MSASDPFPGVLPLGRAPAGPWRRYSGVLGPFPTHVHPRKSPGLVLRSTKEPA